MKVLCRVFIALFLSCAVLTACSHKKAKESGADDVSPMKDSDVLSSDKGNANGLETSHFAYDSSFLDEANKKILLSDVEILKSNPALRVQIEGHCDQRGGIQYNLALGERRVKSVKDFLAIHGVGKKRITTISMGKEKPIDPEETEEAYAKNRRANFIITSK